jgi:hypothetical protein
MCTHCGVDRLGGLWEHDQVKRGDKRACLLEQEMRRTEMVVVGGWSDYACFRVLTLGGTVEACVVGGLRVMWGDVGVEGVGFWGLCVRACACWVGFGGFFVFIYCASILR